MAITVSRLAHLPKRRRVFCEISGIIFLPGFLSFGFRFFDVVGILGAIRSLQYGHVSKTELCRYVFRLSYSYLLSETDGKDTFPHVLHRDMRYFCYANGKFAFEFMNVCPPPKRL